VEPTEVLAVLAALLAGFVTGRRGHLGSPGATAARLPRFLARQVCGAGHLAGVASGEVASTAAGVAQRVASGAGEAFGLGLDAARGAASGAGFGFIQFRAARHVRAHPPRAAARQTAARESAARESGESPDDRSTGEPADAPARAQRGSAAIVFVTRGSRFHRLGCSAVRGEAHELPRDEALAEGRLPCRSCNP
jgi:hypothetical protein